VRARVAAPFPRDEEEEKRVVGDVGVDVSQRGF
jgi:hypothetical protein